MTTSYNLITREGWDARPPESVTPLKWSQVTRFIVHISGAVRTQTVRSIQNFCMDNKGHSDIDYNMIVRGRDLNVGRGDNVGSHTKDNNSTSYGVCIIGLDGDATNDDFNTVRSHYDELCARISKQLTKTTHRGVLGINYTDCPGDEIQAWVNAGMPYKTRRVMSMFLGHTLDPNDNIHISDGVNSRKIVGGGSAGDQWNLTCVPLINAGVPYLEYPNLDALYAGMGPLADDTVGGVQPGQATPLTLQVPAQTVTVELS